MSHHDRNRPVAVKPPWRLTQMILAKSVADNWHDARGEWELERIYIDDHGSCLCGHTPIVEHCIIVNQANGNRAVVGNCCVKRFLGLDLGKVFDGIRRVINDQKKALNAESVEYAHSQGWIDEWERTFCLKTAKVPWAGSVACRPLSPKQQAQRVRINEEVVARFQAQTRGPTNA